MADLINNPTHYKSASEIGRRILRSANLDKFASIKLDLDGTCIDAVESSEYFQNAHAFSVLKYIWRSGQKDDITKDLGKARWYADRYLGFYRPDPLMLGLRDAIEAELTQLKTP